MATRAAAAAAKKKTVILNEKNFTGLQEGLLRKLECCAFTEFSGLEAVKSVEDAVALRRLVSGDIDEWEVTDYDGSWGPERESLMDYFQDAEGMTPEEFSTDGMVLVTTNGRQADKHKFLEGAGFEKLGSFYRGQGKYNLITLWGARTLAKGKMTKTEQSEEVTF